MGQIFNVILCQIKQDFNHEKGICKDSRLHFLFVILAIDQDVMAFGGLQFDYIQGQINVNLLDNNATTICCCLVVVQNVLQFMLVE